MKEKKNRNSVECVVTILNVWCVYVSVPSLSFGHFLSPFHALHSGHLKNILILIANA